MNWALSSLRFLTLFIYLSALYQRIVHRKKSNRYKAHDTKNTTGEQTYFDIILRTGKVQLVSPFQLLFTNLHKNKKHMAYAVGQVTGEAINFRNSMQINIFEHAIKRIWNRND